jgi:hypothetical protein
MRLSFCWISIVETVLLGPGDVIVGNATVQLLRGKTKTLLPYYASLEKSS